MITMDDKYRFEDFGLIPGLGYEHPATPTFQRRTMHIPGRSGEWDFGTEILSKPLSFPLTTNNTDSYEMEQRLENFVAFLFDAYGQPREIKIVYDSLPDKFYMVKVSDSFSPARVRPFSIFTLPFVAFDPYKYASMNQYDPDHDIYYGQVQPGDYYDNPQSFNWIYERHYSGINNYSSLVTDLMIDIQGTVTNPSVTNLNTNQTLTLPDINNGRLVIDGKRFVVIKDGQEILDGSNYNFFHIQPGEVGFLFEGENPDATVTYRWLHKFM